MIMAQIVIDVDGVPVLFSPVLAHSLEPGDLVTTPDAVTSWRVVAITNTRHRLAPMVRVTFDVPGYGDSRALLGANESVLRAVGARAGRGGAR
jgi:hypothetical protein